MINKLGVIGIMTGLGAFGWLMYSIIQFIIATEISPFGLTR